MAHVRFDKPFLWRATPRQWHEYPAGFCGSVKQACAEAAIAAGVAKRVRTPRRGETAGSEDLEGVNGRLA